MAHSTGLVQLQARRPLQARACRRALDVRAGFRSGRFVLTREEDGSKLRYELLGRRLVLGRKGDVVIEDSSVSSKHCELNLSTNTVTVTDLESTNGTFINGKRLGSGGRDLMKPGDTLDLGDVSLRLSLEKGAPTEEQEPPPEPPRPAVLRTGGLAPSDVKLGKIVAGGSFGTVFRGSWNDQPVILKRANSGVESADDLLLLELQLNERVSKQAPGACADFLGAVEVGKGEAGASYNGKLTEGLWLMWRDTDSVTLSSYLGKSSWARDLCRALGVEDADKGLPEEEMERQAVLAVMRQLLTQLSKLHKAGIVHRDVKPANILVDGEAKEMRLIDLGGAAACLGEPLSYLPAAGAFDPLYAPPEKYLLPSGTPKPNMFIAPMLWKAHSPELFDTYSAGMVMLQLCLPALRSEGGMKSFNADYDSVGRDIVAWNDVFGASGGRAAVLAANDSTGWNLVSRLLASVRSQKGGRMTAADALQHPFFTAKPKAGRGGASKASGTATGIGAR